MADDSFANDPENTVARCMAPAIIHTFEAIQVQEKQGEFFHVAASAFQRFPQPLIKEQAVRYSRQGITEGQDTGLLFCTSKAGDIDNDNYHGGDSRAAWLWQKEPSLPNYDGPSAAVGGGVIDLDFMWLSGRQHEIVRPDLDSAERPEATKRPYSKVKFDPGHRLAC